MWAEWVGVVVSPLIRRLDPDPSSLIPHPRTCARYRYRRLSPSVVSCVSHDARLRCGWCQVVWDNVRCLENGEAVSLAGTHLGHNIPDKKGNRFVHDRRCGVCACLKECLYTLTQSLTHTHTLTHVHHTMICFNCFIANTSPCHSCAHPRAATASTSSASPEALEGPRQKRRTGQSSRPMTHADSSGVYIYCF